MKMGILWNYNIKERMKFIFILKFFTFILLMWICYSKSDKSIFVRSLKNEYNGERMFFASSNRLLAKHVFQEKVRSHRPREFLSDNTMNKNMNNVLEYTSTYGQLNKKGRNDLDSYMRDYKRRYSKKNFLGKLDCYYEKKLFHKIEDIDNLIDKMQNDKKSLIKKLFYKYGIRFILFSLVPVLGLIIPLVHDKYFAKNYTCYAECKESTHMTGNMHNKDNYTAAPIFKSTWDAIYVVNSVLYNVTAFIVILLFIYIFIKFIKYQRLKACKSKMSIKEYCKFCKDIF